MPDYHFYTSQEVSLQLPSYFFNSKSYLNQIRDSTIDCFYLISEKSNQTVARIHFKIEHNKALNPARAPFGGLETSIQEPSALIVFWKNIESVLISKGIKEIEIRNWPESYENESSTSTNSFFEKLGFKLAYNDFSFHHIVSSLIPIELFQKPEKKRFRKCVKAGFVFEKWTNPDLDLAYNLLYSFRNVKDIPLNIYKEDLKSSFENFPQQYSLFTVKNKNEIIGLSVCVEVNKDILYHFCLSTNPDYNQFSPSVMLYEGIYRYCQDANYQLFDFGTASIKGKRQEGLYYFKEKLGGIVSLKPTFVKSL